MSKGSKPRPTDSDKFGDNHDNIFNKGKKKVKNWDKTKGYTTSGIVGEDEEPILPWAWAKDALLRQEEMQRKKKKQ
tara:strand:+ start:3459 stop:3686 length:228 start_codon:yes stop_codon:yes gene_type:complete